MGIRMRVNTSELTAASKSINALLARGEDMRPIMDDIGAHLEESTRERFETQRDPDGTPWTPSGRALRQAGPTLTQEGHLRDSITRKISARQVSIGTNILYAATHQLGAVIRPKKAKALAFRVGSQFVTARKVTIPARPFLGVSGPDQDAIGDLVSEYLTRPLR